jgi:hypothetical protein
MINNQDMMDEEKTIVHGSLITSDNEITNPNLLCQLKVRLIKI